MGRAAATLPKLTSNAGCGSRLQAAGEILDWRPSSLEDGVGSATRSARCPCSPWCSTVENRRKPYLMSLAEGNSSGAISPRRSGSLLNLLRVLLALAVLVL